jgi:hypothetical protein
MFVKDNGNSFAYCGKYKRDLAGTFGMNRNQERGCLKRVFCPSLQGRSPKQSREKNKQYMDWLATPNPADFTALQFAMTKQYFLENRYKY